MLLSYAITLSFQATQHFAESYGGAAWLSVIVAFGTAVYLHRRAAAVAFLVACYAVSLWAPALVGDGHAPSAVFALSLGAGLALLLGTSELVRLRRQRSLALALGREQEALRRASEERLQMARDLHDVVAHSISVINVQANTALHLMDRQPERARVALSTINEVSKEALLEIRSVLGVLRGVDEDAPRSPAPGLARLDDLLDNARAAGLDVHVAQDGEPRPLPAPVDLAVFRILQEALTNSARYSAGTGARVRISYRDPGVVIEVDDDGGARPAGPRNGSGHGITGMTERAHSLGGTLEAGHRPDGGFRVRACLPVQERAG